MSSDSTAPYDDRAEGSPDSTDPESAVETARSQLVDAAEHLRLDSSIVERANGLTTTAADDIVALSRVAEAHEARGLWP